MIILAIETSCDETAVTLVKVTKKAFRVLASIVSSQIKLHAAWGGVVPNLAAREHLKNLVPVADRLLKKARISPKKIDLLASTRGPGLIPALLVGNNFSKTLAWVWGKPMLGINHIEGHIYSNFIREVKSQKSKVKSARIKFPALCLVVSGGHTQLIMMRSHLDYKVVGQTLDDAAGEAFDKVARMLGLGYPGGPAISALAEKLKVQNSKFKINFPRPMMKSKDFNFSFSGLKTAVLYLVKKNRSLAKNNDFIAAVCHEFQRSVNDVLISKTIAAAKKYDPKTIMIAGGVSSNKELRKRMKNAIKNSFPGIIYRDPNLKYSVDNAVMIAAAASYHWRNMTFEQQKGALSSWKSIETNANLKLL
jgi:N6-L-threonylcarbamoyladenine synthase